MVDNEGDTLKVVRDSENKNCLRKKEIALFILISEFGGWDGALYLVIETTFFFFFIAMQYSTFGVRL